MSLQLGTTLRNARLDAVETTIGTVPILKIRTGSAPADCGTADAGTVLATITLPSDWMAAASSGAKALSGTWTDSSADATGTAAHFRVYDSGGTVCHIQGTVTVAGGGGDMTLVGTATITIGQPVTASTFTLTEANA